MPAPMPAPARKKAARADGSADLVDSAWRLLREGLAHADVDIGTGRSESRAALARFDAASDG